MVNTKALWLFMCSPSLSSVLLLTDWFIQPIFTEHPKDLHEEQWNVKTSEVKSHLQEVDKVTAPK